MFSTTINAAVIALFVVTSIRGQVLDQDELPLVGAVVRINAAVSKENPTPGESHNSFDCGKVVLTDQNGQFRFAEVSDQMLFTIAAGARDHLGKTIRNIDPNLAEDLEFQLPKLDRSEDSRIITAQVVDQAGVPVPGAAITTNQSAQMRMLARSTMGSATPSTVSDIDGNFSIYLPAPFASVSVKIEASGYAPSHSKALQVGRTNPPIEITAGASLMGRLVAGGEPVAGLTLEIMQKNRSMGNLVTPRQTTTSQDGTFRLDFLPPTTEFILNGLIGQAMDMALPVNIVTTPRSGMLADLGDIVTKPASQLTIKLVTLGGQPIPNGTRCYLKQKHASSPDIKTISPREGGELTFQGVAPEVVELTIAAPGHEVIQSDPFCQVDMNRRLNFKVIKDQTLTIALKQTQ